MAQSTTTDATIKALTTTGERYIFHDSEVAGLELRVSPYGEKVWSYRYRVGSSGDVKRRRAALGAYPAVGLAAARRAALRLKVGRSNGADPVADQRAAEAAAIAAEKAAAEAARIEKLNTIDSLVARYIAHVSNPKDEHAYIKSWTQVRGYLKNVVLKAWSGRPVTSITADECTALVDRKRKTAPVAANRLAAALGSLFSYAVDTENLIASTPVRKLIKPKAEATIDEDKPYNDEEVRRILANLAGMAARSAGPVLLQFHTGCRPSEAADLEWSEIDLEKGWWTIPARRSKSGRTHRIYLTDAAKASLLCVEKVDGARFVFDGRRGDKQRADDNVTIFDGVDLSKRPNPRHAIRSTVGVGMMDAGVSVEHVGFVFDHAVKGAAVTLVYVGRERDPQVRAALERWGVRLEELLRGRRSSNVLTFG